jgi:hypothetical protein
MGTYAAIKKDSGIVIDIIEFDVLSGERIPIEGAYLVRVGEPTPIPIPEIGEKWNGDLNIFE